MSWEKGSFPATTAYTEPSEEITYDNLSEAQKKVVGVIKENIWLHDKTRSTLKHGVIIVGSWGAGKSQVLVTMRKMGYIEAIAERGEIYRWVTKDVELKNEATIMRLLESIIEMAKKCERPFIALDNPDIPVGSNVTEEAAYRFTWRLLEEATFGKLPYLVVTLNEFTYRKFSSERKRSMAKIAQHFDIVKLEWGERDIVSALKARLPSKLLSLGGEDFLVAVAHVARTPRSAIYLFVKGTVHMYNKQVGDAKTALYELIVDEGLKKAYDEYIRLLSQSGYKLSKVKSKRWVDVWRSIIYSKEYRELVMRLIEREGVTTRELYKALGGGYRVAHWPVTAATRSHIIEKDKPLTYRFTDEFLAASTEYAAGLTETAKEILSNMAELYGRTGRK